MLVKFNKYESEVSGDVFFSLAEDAVKKMIDGEEFIEVTSDMYNINKNTVFMVKTSSLRKVGSDSRNN